MIDFAVKNWGWKKGDFINQAIKEFFIKIATVRQDSDTLLQPAAGGLQADEARLQANIEALMPSIWDPPGEWSFKDNRHIYSIMTREQNAHLRLFCNYLPSQLDEASDNFIGPIEDVVENDAKRTQSIRQRYDWFKALSEEEKKALFEKEIEKYRGYKNITIKDTHEEFITKQLAKKQQRYVSHDNSSRSSRIKQWQELQNKEAEEAAAAAAAIDKEEKEEDQQQKVI
jgi:hypothetical protein